MTENLICLFMSIHRLNQPINLHTIMFWRVKSTSPATKLFTGYSQPLPGLLGDLLTPRRVWRERVKTQMMNLPLPITRSFVPLPPQKSGRFTALPFVLVLHHFEIGGCVAAATHSGEAAPLPPN